MTQLLYQTDSYLKEFSGTVLSVDSETRAIVLDQSAFYPSRGGQLCDYGTLKINDITYFCGKSKK